MSMKIVKALFLIIALILSNAALAQTGTGTLQIITLEQGWTIYIDGVEVGTQLNIYILGNVSSGVHTVKMKKGNWDYSEDVNIPSNTTIEFDFDKKLESLLADENEGKVGFFAVETQPELIGGAQAIYKYINEHDLYPEMARVAGINGNVIIGFTVGQDGIPRDIIAIQEKPQGLGFGEAGIEAIKNMLFKPGMHEGHPVSVSMQQVIRFRIE